MLRDWFSESAVPVETRMISHVVRLISTESEGTGLFNMRNTRYVRTFELKNCEPIVGKKSNDEVVTKSHVLGCRMEKRHDHNEDKLASHCGVACGRGQGYLGKVKCEIARHAFDDEKKDAGIRRGMGFKSVTENPSRRGN